MPARLRAALEGRTTLRKKLALNSEMPPRRRFLQTTLLGGVGTAILPALAAARELADTSTPAAQVRPFELDELTIADLQAGMNSGKFSSRSLVEEYQARIEEIDRQGPAVNSVIEINPEAQAIAESLDRERKEKKVRGPLHGVPVLIKDNIDTSDKMQTNAGLIELLGSSPSKASFVEYKLRGAGTISL